MLINERYKTGILLQKADECLGRAELHIQEQRFEDAILSCYHSVYFVLRAFLKKNNLEPEKTSDSVLIFKQNFIDNNIIPVQYYNFFMNILRKIETDNSRSEIADVRNIFDEAESFYNYMTDKM